MSTPATTIGAEAPLRAAVRSLASAQRRQLCVVDRTHRLVGVLALPDSLCLFLRGDAAIERDIEELVVGTHPGAGEVTVQVSAGIVTLNGALRLRSTVEHAGWTACRVPGVIAVQNYLRFEFDDLMITGLWPTTSSAPNHRLRPWTSRRNNKGDRPPHRAAPANASRFAG